LAQILKLPIIICNATQYTETGYVGANVEEMLVALREKAIGQFGPKQGGIIFIDEIDKIARRDVGVSHNTQRDVSGLSVQQELLKLLDGDVVQYQHVDFDVGNILFMAGGAFAGLEDIITARLKQKQIGFCADRATARGQDANGLKAATPDDIMAYGFTPEFVGRFASIVALDCLGKNDLVDIMTKPKNSLLSQYQAIFKASGMDLRVPTAALEWVADQALRNNTGARGLNSILEAHLSPILFEQNSALRGHRGQAPLKEVAFEPDAEARETRQA
jgi:ATP-dependent Clp protease ATP-binding subunit ClpX